MKPMQDISIGSAAGKSYVSQKPVIAGRPCPHKLHVPKAYRLLWHCHWVEYKNYHGWNTTQKKNNSKQNEATLAFQGLILLSCVLFYIYRSLEDTTLLKKSASTIGPI